MPLVVPSRTGMGTAPTDLNIEQVPACMLQPGQHTAAIHSLSDEKTSD